MSGEEPREESRIGGDAGSVSKVKARGAAAGGLGLAVEGVASSERRACALRREPGGAATGLVEGWAVSP